jgi:hypothetical protein
MYWIYLFFDDFPFKNFLRAVSPAPTFCIKNPIPTYRVKPALCRLAGRGKPDEQYMALLMVLDIAGCLSRRVISVGWWRHEWLRVFADEFCRHCDALSFCIHALSVGIIILLLCAIGRPLRCIGTCHAAHEHTRTSTYAGTLVATDCRTGNSAHGSTHYGAFSRPHWSLPDSSLFRQLVPRHSCGNRHHLA